jgi:hypothetical protein
MIKIAIEKNTYQAEQQIKVKTDIHAGRPLCECVTYVGDDLRFGVLDWDSGKCLTEGVQCIPHG